MSKLPVRGVRMPKGHKVFKPGEKGYRHVETPDQYGFKRWASRAADANSDQFYNQVLRASARTHGAGLLGATAAVASPGVAAGLKDRSTKKRRVKVLRAELEKRADPFSAAEPLMRMGRRTKRGFDITSLPKPEPVARRVLERVSRASPLAVGSALVGSSIGGGLIGHSLTRGPEKERRVLQGKVNAKRRRERAAVGKSTASTAAAWATRHRKAILVPTGIGAGGAAVAGRDDSRTAAGAAAGAAAGQGAFRGVGYGLRAKGKSLEDTLPEGMSRSRRTKIMRDHRKKFEVAQGEKPSYDVQGKFFRSYPKELPGSKYKRAVGQMSGRRGWAINTAATAAGAGVGASLARRKQPVEKGLGGLVSGGLLAYGLPRSQQIGAALGHGMKAPSKVKRDVAVAAEAARLTALLGTNRAGQYLNQSESFRRAVSTVPASIRPEVAALAGALIGGHELGRRTERRRNERGQRVTGW